MALVGRRETTQRGVSGGSLRSSTGQTFDDARLKVERLFPEKDRMDDWLDRDGGRFLKALEEAIGPIVKVDVDEKKRIAAFAEPVSAIAKFYLNDVGPIEAACELGIEDPKELQILIKGNRRLRRLGLGPLVVGANPKSTDARGATIKRELWEALDTSLSLFQRSAFELEIGTPHREF